MAAEIAAPLAKVDEIVLLGGQDKITSEITRLVGQVPPAISALTGVDLSKVKLEKLSTLWKENVANVGNYP